MTVDGWAIVLPQTPVSSKLQVFDVTRKVTYKNLPHWYHELREHRPHIPCILVANKIDGEFKCTVSPYKGYMY